MPINHSLNFLYLDQYSAELSKLLCDQWFSSKNRIQGQDIKKFTPVRQLNLFLLKGLLDKWRNETERLKSPWFDYSDPEIKEALAQFMNVLSQNISVKREHFEPLLKTSIQNSFRWVLVPFDFFSEEVDAFCSSSVEVRKIRESGKFLHYNKELYERIWSQLEKMQQSEVYAGELKRMFKQELFDRSFTLTSVQEIVNDFSLIAPCDLQSLTSTTKMQAKVEEPSVEVPAFFEAESKAIEEPIQEFEIQTEPISDSQEKVEETPISQAAFEQELHLSENNVLVVDETPVATKAVETVSDSNSDNESESEYKKRMEKHKELLRKLNPFTSRKNDEKSDVKVTVVSGHPNKNIGYTVFPEPGGEVPAFMQKEGFKKAEANLEKKEEVKNIEENPISSASQSETYSAASPETPKIEESLYDLGVDIETQKPGGLADVLVTAPELAYENEAEVAVMDQIAVQVEAPVEVAPRKSAILATINMNDSIMFKDKLFNKDQTKFEQALIMLEQAGSRFGAMEKILNDLAPDNSWDLDSHEGERFVRVIENYYSKR